MVLTLRPQSKGMKSVSNLNVDFSDFTQGGNPENTQPLKARFYQPQSNSLPFISLAHPRNEPCTSSFSTDDAPPLACSGGGEVHDLLLVPSERVHHERGQADREQ